jgi:hypothetical protein
MILGTGLIGGVQLPAAENPRECTVKGVRFVLHEDHRWLLPIAHAAQERGLLPKPCNLVCFDLHHDALPPRSLPELRAVRESLSVSDVVRLCSQDLSKNDDDWLKAGMELGMFGDAVIFGVEGASDANTYRTYRDHLGGEHMIEMLSRPRSALAYQGSLSDRARNGALERIWDVLGWQILHQVFEFLPDRPRILLSIDLDYFAVRWDDYTFPWPDEVFEREILAASDYWSTQGWTGKAFVQGLAEKAGLVAICRESECTGGPEKSRLILSKLDECVFDGALGFDADTRA